MGEHQPKITENVLFNCLKNLINFDTGGNNNRNKSFNKLHFK